MDQADSKSPREQIMETAKRLFLTQGYSATSMRDIAKGANNRAVAGIYNHFATKEDIFKALIDAASPYHELLPLVESITGETAPELIANALKAVLPLMTRYYDFVDLIQIDAREFQGQHMVQMLQIDILPRALVILQRVLELPGLRPMEPFVLLRIIASTVIGYILSARFGPPMLLNLLSPDEWVDELIRVLLKGIAA